MRLLVCRFLGLALAFLLLVQGASAQERALVFATVDRPPFSTGDGGGGFQGFSIDLMRAIGEELGAEIRFERVDSFPEMLARVEAEEVDGAIANISITGAREQVVDFSQPIFRSGLRILVPAGQDGPSIWSAYLNFDLLLAVLVAFALLFGGGMLMWVFERKRQPYFDRPMSEAMFPSFWWALNLVVNGGFEERQPRSFFGRLFGVLLVISSLFVVSLFVAHITATITVEAITGKIDSISDLDGRLVGTMADSTASQFLATLDMPHISHVSFDKLIANFEAKRVEAVVFDGPLLAHYVQNDGAGQGTLLANVFRPENYGIALPTGSDLREPINVALLTLKESGRYDDIATRWFGGQR